MREKRQISLKTHDPFVILQFLGGSPSIHLASLLFIIFAKWNEKKEIPKEVNYLIDIVQLSNTISLIGFVGKIFIKNNLATATEEQQGKIVDLKQDIYEKEMATK